jgi:phosphonopyruvate decarboxylase
MIDNKDFLNALQSRNICFFAGVPDSLLKDFCAYLTDHAEPSAHVITANEGAAVGLGMGHHFATGGVPLIYMQNSGLGNAINPLLSLADPEVYATPMLLLVGWRGEPGVKDEPQHVKQGRVMLAMLSAMDIPYAVIGPDDDSAEPALSRAMEHFKTKSGPFVLAVQKGTFQTYKLSDSSAPEYTMTREEAIGELLDPMSPADVVVSTTGMASRELFELRVKRGEGHERDFLTVGGMGHASQIALGIAQQVPDRKVFCIDGDGAALMHLGSFPITGISACANFRHVLINNGAHDSVGGQPTVGFDIDYGAIAIASGYQTALRADSKEQLTEKMKEFITAPGPSLLEIRVSKGARKDLGRPTKTPVENKQALMKFLF